jgi:deoxyribose-phosphate aldolase
MVTAKQIAQRIDQSLLKADNTPDQVVQLCEGAVKYGFYSVDVLPCYVHFALKHLVGSDVKVITVIGYPLGANTTAIKVLEALKAVKDGAEEIDMVMNIGLFKAGEYREVKKDIHEVACAVKPKPVKVIIETGFLTNEEIVKASKLVKEAGAAFVKTGTGYGPKGATVPDIKLIRKAVGKQMGIKAAGGIRTAKQAIALIKAGATRLGTSSGVEIVKELLPKEKKKPKKRR